MNAPRRHALYAALSMLALGGGAFGQTPPQAPLRIGIIGAGHIGGTLAALWVSAGHEVMISSIVLDTGLTARARRSPSRWRAMTRRRCR